MIALVAAAFAGPVPDLDDPLRTGRRAPGDAAVVIGLEDYAFLPDVPYARRDAAAMADWFLSTHGVPVDRVKQLSSGSREQITAAVAAAGASVKGGGTVWLYFAGHGVAAPSDGRRLLLGDDARQAPEAFEARGVAVEDLEKLAAKGGGRVVTLVDACFNGTGRSGEPVVAGTRFAVPDWAVTGARGRLHWSAAGPDQVARPLDAVRHGAFTWLALGALRGWADGEIDGVRDGVVTASEAQIYLVRSMRAVGLSEQEPMMRVDDAASWVLAAQAPEQGPRLDRSLLNGAGPQPAPRLADGGLWPPELLAVAAAHDVTLPLNRNLLGYKDATGRRVKQDTYMDLVRATERGRRGIRNRAVGIGLTTVGWLGAFGFGTAALVAEEPIWAVPASISFVGSVTGMGLTVAGQTAIQNATDPGFSR